MKNFDVFVASGFGAGRGSYDVKYSGQVVAVTNKLYIWISEEVVRLIGNPTSVNVLYNSKEWAVSAAKDDDRGAYKIGKAENKEPNRIRCGAFIKSSNLPIGYLYRGRLIDGVVVFSKTPTEQV
jgi:hypothetical protein